MSEQQSSADSATLQAVLLHTLTDIAAKRYDVNANIEDICSMAQSALSLAAEAQPKAAIMTRYGEPAIPVAIKAIRAWQANRATSFTPTDILTDCGDAILAALTGAVPMVSASVREAAERVLATAQSADEEQTQALGDLRSALDAEPQTAPKLEALESCKGEQLKFEEWAAAEKYDMHEHPLHYLFMDDKTNAARQGWKAALRYAATVIAGAQCQAVSTERLYTLKEATTALEQAIQTLTRPLLSPTDKANGGQS
jgi:hypothetical protein